MADSERSTRSRLKAHLKELDKLNSATLARDDLQARNLLAAQGEWIVLTREALLKVDTLLHAFFLPQHRGPRYV